MITPELEKAIIDIAAELRAIRALLEKAIAKKK